MPYQLILSEPIDETATYKDTGENIFIDNLPYDYPVYLFYYPGALPNRDLEDKLRNLGINTGTNLFVNIGRLNDPNYRKIANIFNIKDLPVIVMTAVDELASRPVEFLTAYVRIDSTRLLSSPDLVTQCVQRLFNLFIQGKIYEAMSQAKQDKRDILVSHMKGIITNAVRGIGGFLRDIDISVCVGVYKFELKHSGR